MLLGSISKIDQIIQAQVGSCHLPAAHFAAADALTVRPAVSQLELDVLPQAGTSVPGDDMGGRDIADDAVDSTVAWNGWFNIRDKADKFIRGIRLVSAPFPNFIKRCVFEQLRGLNLDFIGAETFPQPGKVSQVGFQGGTQ